MATPTLAKLPRGKLPTVVVVLVALVAACVIVTLCVVALALLGPSLSAWHFDGNYGIETSPEEFANAWNRWNERSFSRYRMIASYAGTNPSINPGCRQEVEVYQDHVVAVLENDCSETWSMTVDGIFELFQPEVGTETSRAEVSDGCHYYIVDARYHDEFGYPVFIESRLVGSEERYQFAYRSALDSCLMNLPPRYKVEIESLIPLD